MAILIRRREFIVTLGGAAVCPLAAGAQQGAQLVRRIDNPDSIDVAGTPTQIEFAYCDRCPGSIVKAAAKAPIQATGPQRTR